jgi:hypothetical protein
MAAAEALAVKRAMMAVLENMLDNETVGWSGNVAFDV